jgi:hypothetical protein
MFKKKTKEIFDYVLVPDIYISESSYDSEFVYWSVEKGTYLADEMNGTIFKIYRVNKRQVRILPEYIYKDEKVALSMCKTLNRNTTENVMRLARDSYKKIEDLEQKVSKILKLQ